MGSDMLLVHIKIIRSVLIAPMLRDGKCYRYDVAFVVYWAFLVPHLGVGATKSAALQPQWRMPRILTTDNDELLLHLLLK